ncbi:MAG: helix-turn-helix transcriptional regulator [Nitrosospira sp.]
MGPRLIQLRRRYKLNQSKLGDLCGVSKGAVSQWETGISMPEMKKLVELRSKLLFSLDWLITGEGEPAYSSPGDNPIERRHDDRRQARRRDRRQCQRREADSLNNSR